MSSYFTHLHLHTEYSLLDGAITIDNLIEFAKKHKLPSLAISDHGNIFGAVQFFNACKKAGIKPVLGIEAYLTEDIGIKNNENRYYHLLLLVENQQGYKNLCKLIHAAYTKGFYFKPRIDYALLETYHEGLIATSSCLGGHVPQLLKEQRINEANACIDRMLSIFGENNYFLEVQPGGDVDEQRIINEQIFALSKQRGIPSVATADCHYYRAEDRQAHEVMLAIQTHHKMSDHDRMSFGDWRVHMRTPDEMLAAFPHDPDAVWQSGAIADRCSFQFDTSKHFFPQFEIPTTESDRDYFARLCHEGLRALYDNDRFDKTHLEQYQARLNLEIDLIARMGFITYFLVVSDFIQWSRQNGVPVGPGRGSAAGSLVAWALRITDIDPIKYNLLFERFLNPERVSMPDIDIDFCVEGRERVINYVRDRYGHDKVCQIITFGTMMAKGVVKDVGRALGIPFEDTNAITNLIPDTLKISLKEALEQEPRLAQLRDSSPAIAQLFDIAMVLEGLTRHASKHAAGIVITPEPIDEMLPVYVPPKTNDLVTQYAMTDLESLGFLKMDFLGLKNLTLIQRVVELIKQNHGIDLDPVKLPFDDAKTFELLSRGETTGVFQLESSGLKDVLRRLKPETFEDIIAVNALYRPGPLGSGMVDDFIERRHGRQQITYLFPELEPILKETYGVIVYQEQVMKIASAIGNYSLGEADILRRAMGKKKAEVMVEQRAIFVKRATEGGFNEHKAGDLFDLMAYFAGYGFNKSHSAAYGMIAYQTAYFKAHYAPEFMCCLISLEARDPEKMAFYIQETRDMGIDVLPPDINASDAQFTTEQGKVRFGLVGIKNAGDSGLDSCLEERAKEGPFKDLLDFCVRVDLRRCNRRFIESLISAGAFDRLAGSRAQKTNELDTVIDRAWEKKDAATTGQMGLFAPAPSSSPDNLMTEVYTFAPCEEWTMHETLEKEKEVLGLYVSARPLDQYKRPLSWLTVTGFIDAKAKQGNVICCGFKKSMKTITTKKGDRMAFLELEDYQGSAEVVIFPKLYQKISDILEKESIFVVSGEVDSMAQTCKIKAQDCQPIETVLRDWSFFDRAIFKLPEQRETELLIEAKKRLVPGRTAIEFMFTENNAQLSLVPKGKFTATLEDLTHLDQQGVTISLNFSR